MFDAIGEGHKIMHEGQTKELDLDELERLAAQATPGPWKEGRHDMFSIVEGAHAKYIYANSIPVAISTGEEKDCERVLADARYIAAACNAVPSLIARVRELERQREYLARELSSDDDQADCDHTHLPCEHRSVWYCKAGLKGQMQCWISEAEKFAKEGGECV